MKKCASCTKDLPDAALHCVFCGAKQPPAPASTAGMAKTVMGYGGQELDQLRQQAAAANAARQVPQNLPAAAPYSAPRPAGSSQPPPMQGGYPPPQAPASPANAKTMFAPSPVGGPSPQGAGHGQGPMGGMGAAPMGPSPMGPGPSPMAPPPAGMYQAPPMPHAPQPIAPVAPIPSASPPYMSSQPQAQAGRPIDPWQDALRLMMYLWGALLLAAFATPLTTEPLTFNWNLILDGEGTAKLPPLIVAAVGLLSIVLAAIPLATAARGMIAMLLGLAGIFVPVVLRLGDAELGLQMIVALVAMVGWVLLIANLLVRDQYRDAALPRILITVGALAAMAPYVVPINGDVPLVGLFTELMDAPGAGKIVVILAIVQLLLLVLSLLAWLPSPSTAGAKPLAWILILWGLVMHAAMLFLVGDPSMVEQTPYTGAMSWVVAGGPMTAGLGVAYLAITGYGMASVIGKQLE